MALKVFNRNDFEDGIKLLSNIGENLKEKVANATLDRIAKAKKLLEDSRDCICYEKTSVPEGYDADYEIRKFFKNLMAAVRDGIIDNKIIQNLRDVADSPTWILDVLTSYLLAYTVKEPAIRYIEEKHCELVKSLDEIKKFGYKSQAQRNEEYEKKNPKKSS